MIVLQAVADGRLGGGTTHVIQLVTALAQAGIGEVHLVSQAGSPALLEAARAGAVVHGANFFRSRLDPGAWLDLRRLVRKLRPALIHAHGARAGLPVSGAASGGSFFYSVHGYHFAGKPAGARYLGLLAERRCSARADLTVFVSRHDRDLAARHGILRRCRAHRVIPNGIELRDLPQAAESDPYRLAFLGRLEPQKNPLLLLDILDRLGSPPYRLAVIGDGSLMGAMRQRAAALGLADRVFFLGALPRHEGLAELARTGCLLLPSHWEGLPLAPLEAMAIGVPVVASAAGGTTEVIRDGETGFLVERPDSDRYAQAVRRLVEEPALRHTIIARARASVRDRFSWAATKEIYLDLYRDALGIRAPAAGGLP